MRRWLARWRRRSADLFNVQPARPYDGPLLPVMSPYEPPSISVTPPRPCPPPPPPQKACQHGRTNTVSRPWTGEWYTRCTLCGELLGGAPFEEHLVRLWWA